MSFWKRLVWALKKALSANSGSRQAHCEMSIEMVQQNSHDDRIEDVFPDGGYGWLQVLFSFLMQLVVLGLVNSYGVYQESYLTSNHFEGN